MKLKIFKIILFFLFVLGVFSYAQDEWKEYKQQHFIVYYKDAPQDFIKSVEEAAENYYHEIASNLGFTRYDSWTWDDRAKIYIYDDSDDYVKSSKQAQWSHGVASPQDKVIRTFPAAHGFFDSILPHELGHIIFREFVGFQVQVPLWFEEGVAMYQEKAKRWGANQEVLKAMQKGNFIPLNELTLMGLGGGTDTDTVNLFYAEAASVVYYMITELGEYRFVQFCRKLKETNSFEFALRDVYVRFKDFNDLNRAWMEYIKK